MFRKIHYLLGLSRTAYLFAHQYSFGIHDVNDFSNPDKELEMSFLSNLRTSIYNEVSYSSRKKFKSYGTCLGYNTNYS